MRKQIISLMSFILLSPSLLMAQSFRSNIEEATGKLTMIVVLVCAASGVWAGIEFAKGNPMAPNRILMSAIGAVVAVIGAQVVKFVVGT
ncbi:MAG: hypothetical protein COV44_02900 [Deltaproteobacteria bacterium CG11_big_fil_rev_8_21_14_0_20_45_16]|nr:MAG: hypothetical protein COV44_02900 [Deltaproteobacteria bacterium CG11_big_fil_rev_8_21_14_0_20_45_16]